jgi:putative ABC transport system ATP-binding protein
VEISSLGERQRDAFRARNVGYMFQDFHLMPGYTALENVTLALGLCGLRGSAALKRARETLQRVGLGNRLQHTPTQLSTGERQRVALARAIASRPALLLADEPTAHLDRVRSHDALNLLIDTAHEVNATLLVVTHDPLVVEQFEHQLSLGELASVSTAGVPISDVPVLGARPTI